MKIPYILIALLLSTLGHFSHATETSWKTWKQNSQQHVSYRPVIIDGTKLVEIKANATVHSTIAAFLVFLQDVENTPNWLVNAKESQIITRDSPKESSFYIKLAKIWPMKARLLLLHSSYWQNNDLSVEIELTDADLTLNKQAAFINDINAYFPIKTYSAHWRIIPKVKNTESEPFNEVELFIEYIFIADGKGKAPKWLADHFALKSIWKSMRNIRRQLPDEKWQTQKIKGIAELTTMPLKSTVD